MPRYYVIRVTKVGDSGKEHLRGIVYAEGETKGFATLQSTKGRITGREAIPSESAIPKWLKMSRKHELDLDKYIFGGGK